MLSKDAVEHVSVGSGQQKYTAPAQIIIHSIGHTGFVAAGRAEIIGLCICLTHISMKLRMKKVWN